MVVILDSLQEVALLRLVAVLEELSNVLTHTGCETVSSGLLIALVTENAYRR